MTARRALLLNAVIAWSGVLLTATISALGRYDELPLEVGLYGGHPAGAAGALPRLLDTFSYFTIWSNVVVAVSLTLLVRGTTAPSPTARVLRLAGLVMIIVTGIVYQVLLAPTAVVTGWSRVTDPTLHVVTPVLTVLVWLVWGPRGWITLRLVPAALVVPLAWIAWMLARGAVADVYPYGFANVTELGYASVLTTVGAVLVFGLVVALGLWAVDRVLAGRGRGPAVT